MWWLIWVVDEEKNNPPSQTSGNITLHNVHYSVHYAALTRGLIFFFLMRRPPASFKYSHAFGINQAEAIMWNWGAHYKSGLAYLDTAPCPWSPALSAECQMTTRPTWWWISHRGRPRGQSTLLGILHLKVIETYYIKHSMWIISDTKTPHPNMTCYSPIPALAPSR